jgi:hypothetical protein
VIGFAVSLSRCCDNRQLPGQHYHEDPGPDELARARIDELGAFAKVHLGAITRLVGAMLLEQNDEGTLKHRYMQLEGLQSLVDNQLARLSAVVN